MATALGPGAWRAAYGSVAQAAPGPYGPLASQPDELGLLLPEGFTARLLATSGQVVAGTEYTWHTFPDGGATFTADDGGWFYVSNSEIPDGAGGVGVLRFDEGGEVVDAYRILADTSTNCAGGATPWGTWLSCEEVGDGQVWECDPTRRGQGEVRPALGRFEHEAVAVDPDGEQLYLTEDDSNGRFYRFTPSRYPSLDEGRLAVAEVAADGAVTWLDVPDPQAAEQPIREQVGGTPFNGGEGVWFDAGEVYFTTKGDNTVRSYDTRGQRIEVIYAAEPESPDAVLTGVDNIVAAATGDLYVCEDGGNMELVLITPDRTVTPFLRALGQEASELAGAAFSPGGDRLLLSSQRGGGGSGLTYVIEGPFRQPEPEVEPAGPTTTLRAAGGSGSSGSEFPWAPVVGVGAAVVAAAGAGAVAVRRRQGQPEAPEGADGNDHAAR